MNTDPSPLIQIGTASGLALVSYVNALAVVSDAVLTQLIVNASAVAIASVGAYFAYKAKTHAEKAKAIAEDTNTAAIKTLKIVNGHSGTQLHIASAALRRVADLSQRPEDAAIADESERLLAEHLAQAKIETEKQEQKEAEDRAAVAGKKT